MAHWLEANGAGRRTFPAAVVRRFGDPVVTAESGGYAAAPIDPLAGLENGRYSDEMVTVIGPAGVLPELGPKIAETRHFELWRERWRLVIRHRISDSSIDDGLTSVINDELFRPGWVSGSSIFERIFAGVVLTSRPSALDAWILFYQNSFRRYADARSQIEPLDCGSDAVSEFASIHAHADSLVPARASVLEIGSCFGFLALFLARLPNRTVIASDISPGTVRLLSAVALQLPVTIETLVADAARIPLPDRSVDVVLLVHLLEHLDSRRGLAAIDEAMRVAERRVVIAVPYETEATAAYGHVRTINEADLRAWGCRAVDWNSSVHGHRGGWLVLDRRKIG